MFKNISDFNNVNDYLPILNAVLITDMVVILLLIFGFIKSKVLVEWYKKYNLSAVIADILIIFIGIIITRYIYPKLFGEFSIIKFTILAVLVQIIHDILFYLLFKNIPRGTNMMLDTFKDYANEVGFNAILADSGMMIMASLLSSYLTGQSLNTNSILLIVLVYILPYIVYN
jgi:hypothetical protein